MYCSQMYIKYLPFQQCTAQASDMEAFLVSEHDRQALEVKVGVFDFPSVTMGGVCDEHGADDGQFDF